VTQRWLTLMVLFLGLLVFPVHANSASKTKKKESKIEKIGFQDIYFGTSFAEVKSILEKKYPDLVAEDGGMLKLGDLTKFVNMQAPGYKYSESDFYKYRYKIGDLPVEVDFFFKEGKFVTFQISGYTFGNDSSPPMMKAMATIYELFLNKYGSTLYTSDLDTRSMEKAAFYKGGYYIGAAWAKRGEAHILVGAEFRRENGGGRSIDFGRVSVDKDDPPLAFFLRQFDTEMKKAKKQLDQETTKARRLQEGLTQF
jgi:hypothetical protein